MRDVTFVLRKSWGIRRLRKNVYNKEQNNSDKLADGHAVALTSRDKR
jgi:hypothetical protein